MKHNGELRLALKRIAEIRKQLEEEGDLAGLTQLSDKVGIAYEACLSTVERRARIEEERMILGD